MIYKNKAHHLTNVKGVHGERRLGVITRNGNTVGNGQLCHSKWVLFR